MTRSRDVKAAKAERLEEQWLRELLAAYAANNARTDSRAWRAHADATQVVDDLAFHQPDLFWRFVEFAVDSEVSLDRLGDVGAGPLTWLLRLHPDDYAERVAGAARRSDRMRSLVAEVDQDRIAPDVWRRLAKVLP